MMKNLLKTAVVGAAVVASSLAMAQPAMASSFSWNVGDGVISYDDASNKFCVRAYDSEGARSVEVELPAGGSTFTITDLNNYYGKPGGTCRYLNNIYSENRSLTVTAESYWGERGTWVDRGSKSFTT
ncbi:hypothetical protein ACTWPT_40060 [Nonomuraea sp. 3N208]|uniref:hypothetical protein n=1 Tax=Nonomuraea sp. 3N208 TaxID=3457421 RepID=UPI003FD28633